MKGGCSIIAASFTLELEMANCTFPNSNSIYGLVQPSVLMEWWNAKGNKLLSRNLRPLSKGIFPEDKVKLLANNIEMLGNICFFTDSISLQEISAGITRVQCENPQIISGEQLYFCVGNFPEYFSDKKIPVMITQAAKQKDTSLLYAYHHSKSAEKEEQRHSVRIQIMKLKSEAEFVKEDLKRAEELCDYEPVQSALTSYFALEKCLGKIYTETFKGTLNGSPFSELHKNEKFKYQFDDNILGMITYLNRVRNNGVHNRVPEVTTVEAQKCLMSIVSIVQWYVDDFNHDEKVK